MSTMRRLIISAAFSLPVFLFAADPLETSFRDPPTEAKPLTWWHWLNGSITKEGITGDLEAMKQAGLGGCYLFNCGGRMPKGDVRFMQPKWLEMMDHTVREAERLGLKFGIHNCDGFSQSGGPWIKPETSMKELTWTATDVAGPSVLDVVLKQPEMKEAFYRDIAVVAFPVPEGGPLAGATLRGTRPEIELKKLTDGNEKTQAAFSVKEGGNEIDFVFQNHCVVRSLVIRSFDPHRWEEDFPIRLEVSEDGKIFSPAGEFTANWDYKGGGYITAAFAGATGRVFRLAFNNPIPVQIGEIELSSAAKVHFAEAKAARLRSRGHGAETRHHQTYPGPDRNRLLAPSLVVAKDKVCDLTKRMQPDGKIKWEVPAGRWRILRIGFTSNGHYVAPATEEGRGLECDKLDPAAIRFHLDHYVGKLLERAGAAAGRTFAAVELDSWECGIQNWTAGFDARFKNKVGYDLLPFMPALLEGWIVDDADGTDRILWDWRRFLADQFSESYFSQAAKYLKEKGVTYVGESTGRQQYLYDVAYIRNSDVTMGEFWIDSGPGQGVRVDNKVASSIAHVAGKKIIASESYTSSPSSARWQNHPFSLKAEGDRAFCAGINQFVFHTFAHQPYNAIGPGFTFFFWGLNFNRGNTWWDSADAWMAYLTRCNYMLRQGQSVSDVLWFVGEDVPNRIGWRDELKPVLPAGYDFDGCDVAAIMAARVEAGRIVLPSGTDYSVLLLPDLPTMRPAVAKKVRELAESGATILAPRRAVQSPSLNDRGAGDAAVRESMTALWDDAVTAVDRKIGKGRFFGCHSFEEVFKEIGRVPDFEYSASNKDAEVLFVHRRAGATEIYFVSNQLNRQEKIRATFRAGTKAPEFWDPASGTMIRAGAYRQTKDGRVDVPLTLDPNGSVFVVFRDSPAADHVVSDGAVSTVELFCDDKGALSARLWEAGSFNVTLDSGRDVDLKLQELPAPVRLDGPWQLSFPPNLGAPASSTFGKLISWPVHDDPGIRFFSGTATYILDFDLPESLFGTDRELFLDLGDVQVIARVTLNGNVLPTLWKPPFRINIDGAAKPGKNSISIRVTNLWPNRMIGDATLPDDMEWQAAGKNSALPKSWPDWLVNGKPRPSGRIAFCTRSRVYSKNDPLLPSGLIGPVSIKAAAVVRPDKKKK